MKVFTMDKYLYTKKSLYNGNKSVHLVKVSPHYKSLFNEPKSLHWIKVSIVDKSVHTK